MFGAELHSYVITDAIRDDKVLKFKVDYNDVRPQFKALETEKDPEKLTALEQKQAFYTLSVLKKSRNICLTILNKNPPLECHR